MNKMKKINEDFSSRDKILEDMYESMLTSGEKEKYIDYFYKVEKLNKKLRKEFYDSSLELFKSLELFFPEGDEVWKNEKMAHNEVFRSPLEVYAYLHRQYFFYKLLNNLFIDRVLFENDIKKLKECYIIYIKKYISVAAAKGFEDIYRNYLSILDKSSELFEELLFPMTNFVNEDEYNEIIKNPTYLNHKKTEFLDKINKLNDVDFEKFYNFSIDAQRKIVEKTERFTEFVFGYYDNIFTKIIDFIRKADTSYNLIENKLADHDFEKYNSFMKKMVEKYLEEYISSEEFAKIMSNSIMEVKLFINYNEKSEVDILKEEIESLQEQIKDLEKQMQ